MDIIQKKGIFISINSSKVKQLLFLLILFFSVPLMAQQEAMYTHYMYNTLNVNPAYAGSRDALTITALHRSQWVGFDGAPKTQTLTLHSPVIGDAVNLGFSMVHDEIGPTKNTSLFLDYAYRIRLTEKSRLAFGLSLGFNYYNFNLSNLSLSSAQDEAFNFSDNDFAPNVGFGAYYSRDNFYVGISTPKLFENTYDYSANEIDKEQLHYFLIMGGIIPFTEDIKFKPTGLLKVTKGAPIEGDITADFLFYDRFQLGMMGRSGDALGAMVGYYILDNLCVGYSFDWSFINETGKYNKGTHEVMLQYDFIFNDKKHKIVSPRYFSSF